MNFFDHLPEDLRNELKSVRDFFARHYPQTELYAVGGAVRDAVMGRKVYDLDIECFGIDPQTFDRAMARLGAKGVGRSFFVYKYGKIDLALPRIERKIGRGHRGFAVSLATDTKEASRRRDFTMNALMLRLRDGRLIDHWGGMEDIARRKIRVVDPATFVEDSLRVLRAMQFSSRLKFRIEPESCRLMRRMPLDDLSGDRIFWEFEKLFLSDFPHYGLAAIMVLGIDDKIFGFTLRRDRFLPLARRLLLAKRRFEDTSLRPYFFLYLLTTFCHRRAEAVCEAVHAPNRYRKTLAGQKAVPMCVTDRFLGAIALRYPLSQWLGSYARGVAERAEALGIWDKPFDPGVTAADLMAEGLRGKALGEALRKARLAAVRARFGKRPVWV